MWQRCLVVWSILWLELVPPIVAFVPTSTSSRRTTNRRTITATDARYASTNPDNSNSKKEDPEELQRKAQELREQIRKMEASLGETRPRNYDTVPPTKQQQQEVDVGMSLDKKRILVVGANGRLGSMVCRHLLRTNPKTEIVACVHYVGENSPTSRGYGRLSYEVGAEDGIGSIGAAWSADDRVATFEYDTETMQNYNLQNLRVVECELLDPVQCDTICEGVDSIVWCATDFNGNQPRAISGLNLAFLFRAVADPTKGRVEIEGLRNMLGALKNAKQEGKWNSNTYSQRQPQQPTTSSQQQQQQQQEPINVVLVSATPYTFQDFETPFGTFHGLKREGEDILKKEFPSLSYTILQMGRYEDNFVEEGLDVVLEDVMENNNNKNNRNSDDSEGNTDEDDKEKEWRRLAINRRDAARAVAESLTNENLIGKTLQVWTAKR